MISHLQINTTDAQRIIKRLANHWRHKMTVEVIDNQTIFHFSEADTARFYHDEQTLSATLQTAEADACDKLKTVIINHIWRMAGEELAYLWTDES